MGVIARSLSLFLAVPPAAAPSAAASGGPGGTSGTIDWLAGTVRVLGVGSPRILSPTGSLLERDAIELAREDAFRRLAAVLAGLPRPEPRIPGPDPLAAAGDRAAASALFAEPLFLSDGTAHMAAEVSLAGALGLAVPTATARVARIQAPVGFTPCVELRLISGGGDAVLAGLTGDAIPHLRYRRKTSDAASPQLAGSPSPCLLALVAPLTPLPDILEVELP